MQTIVNILCSELIETGVIRAEENPELKQLLQQRDQLADNAAALVGVERNEFEELGDMETACRAFYGQLMFREGMSLLLRLFLELI